MNVMKKNIYLYAILMLLVMSNCNVNDQLHGDAPESKVLFANNELIQDIYMAPTLQNYTYNLLIYRSGIHSDNLVKVGISVDASILEEHNLENGTEYELIPSEYYEFDNEINISSGKEYGSVDVHIQVRRIADELDADSQYVIPFTISKADGADINDDKNDVLILFNLREPFIRQESYGIDEGASVGSMNFTRSYTVYVEFENEWEINAGYQANYNLVESYNVDNGTDYKPLPESNLVNIPSEFTLSAGVNSIDVEIELSPDNLQYFEPYLLPLQLVSYGDFPVDSSRQIIYLLFQRDFDQNDAIIIPLTDDMIETYTQESSEGPKANLVDGSTSTYWHSAWSSGVAPLPHWIQINFDQSEEIGGFNYTFRQPSGINDRPNHFDVQVSEDGSVWNTVWESKAELPVEPVDQMQTLVFDQNYRSQYFRIRILDTFASGSWTHMSTLEVFKVSE